MKHILSAAAAVLAASCAAAGQTQDTTTDPLLARLQNEAATHGQAMDLAGYLTDVIGARLTASPEARDASEWARRMLASWGLARAHVEPWGFLGHAWSVERVEVEMVAPSHETLIALPKPWTAGTPGPVRGLALKASLAKEQDLAAWRGRLAKKIVFLGEAANLVTADRLPPRRLTDEDLAVLRTPAPRPPRPDARQHQSAMRFREHLTRFLEGERALAAVEPGAREAGTLLVAQSYDYLATNKSVGVPTLSMTAEHFNRVVRDLDRGVPVELELDVRTRFSDNVPECANVIADLPGSDLADEVVIVGAHLDSWHGGTGATDDAAGVVAAMEALRLLKAVGAQPRRTIRLALWTGEEQGLLGSRGYVTEHYGRRDEPKDELLRALPFFQRATEGRLHLKPEQAKVDAYFNLDHGAGRIRGIYLQGNTAAAPLVERWFAPLRAMAAETVSPRSIVGSDHQSFESVGIPAFHFIQDGLDYATRAHHTNMDVFERLEPDDLRQLSIVLAYVLYQAATSPERVPRLPPRPSDN